ncbi:hypothetical protein ISU10_10875 [Nocardioides agariphilus]|jgi:hypothetical protein|uniref:Uncharacterized protein n=1 Tax=Nocardioides agariphilus TaxID=433664 RepID=A0A930VKC4_9ACTN|nr:hypothetical protein [Nocardioides agariphilus]MBF4768273.1 hypothetical protein [Nocardioides agariphilus]
MNGYHTTRIAWSHQPTHRPRRRSGGTFMTLLAKARAAHEAQLTAQPTPQPAPTATPAPAH